LEDGCGANAADKMGERTQRTASAAAAKPNMTKAEASKRMANAADRVAVSAWRTGAMVGAAGPDLDVSEMKAKTVAISEILHIHKHY
jgi:hypothetical protein